MGPATKSTVVFVLLTIINACCTTDNEISAVEQKKPKVKNSQQLRNMVRNALSSLMQQTDQLENGPSIALIMKTFPNILNMLTKEQNWLERASDISMPSIIDMALIFPTNLTSTCRQHLLNPEGYKHISGSLWQMLDAFGKPPSGITRANMHWLGRFWQCLKVKFNTQQPNKTDVNDNEDQPITGVGEYCVVKMYFPNSVARSPNQEDPVIGGLVDFRSIKWGTCLPSTCSLEDKRTILNHYLNWLGLTVVIDQLSCQTSEWKRMNHLAIITTIIMIIPIALVLMATAFDCRHKDRPRLQNTGKLYRFCHTFSAKSTTANLCSVASANKPEYLKCLYAIRLFLTLEVVITHCVFPILASFPWNNQLDIVEFRRHPLVIVWNHDFSVMNCFFYISGFCLSYFTITGSTFNIAKTYLKRYFRISAPFLYAMLFVMGPMAYISKGPKWPELDFYVDGCRNKWWKPLLYSKSIANPKDQIDCIVGEWSLRVEMQLYLLALPLVWLLFWKPKIGQICTTVVVILSTAAMGIMTVIHELKIFHGFTTDSIDESLKCS